MTALGGRHALVTGGGRGIGRAIAAALTAAGASVTVLGRDGAALSEAVAAGHAAGYVRADVTDEAAVTKRDPECSRDTRAGEYPHRQRRRRRAVTV